MKQIFISSVQKEFERERAAEKDAPRVIVQGVLDWDDLPKAGEVKEVEIPLTRPKFSKQIGTLTLLVQG